MIRPAAAQRVSDPGGLDRAAVVSALEANMRAYWLSLGGTGRGVVHDDLDLQWAYTGWPVLNRVAGARLDEGEVDVRIAGLRRQFDAWNASVTWLVGPSSRPADLGPRLAAGGFAYEASWAGMALDLAAPESHARAREPSGLTIQEVDDARSQERWLEIAGTAFALPAAAREVFRRRFGAGGDEPHRSAPWRRFVGYLQDVPVSTATLVETPGAAGIYLVGTLPSARRQGLGSALTRHALHEARAQGHRLAVLQAAGRAEALYRDIGFDECCRIGIYRWAPPRWRQRLGRVARLLRLRP
jgi:ribosomal protein S18 acetylase RimI-like enzyme